MGGRDGVLFLTDHVRVVRPSEANSRSPRRLEDSRSKSPGKRPHYSTFPKDGERRGLSRIGEPMTARNRKTAVGCDFVGYAFSFRGNWTPGHGREQATPLLSMDLGTVLMISALKGFLTSCFPPEPHRCEKRLTADGCYFQHPDSHRHRTFDASSSRIIRFEPSFGRLRRLLFHRQSQSTLRHTFSGVRTRLLHAVIRGATRRGVFDS